MKKGVLVIFAFSFFMLFAGQKQDLQFILGLCSDKNYALAKTEILKFLQKYPSSQYKPKAIYLLAEVYYNSKEYDNALQKYEEVEKLLPEYNDKIILGRAKSYYNLGELSKAKVILDGYSYKDNLEQVYCFLSLIAYERKDFIQSVIQSKNSLNVKPTGYARVQLILSYLALDKPEQAKEELTASLQDREYGQNLLNYLSYLLGKKQHQKIVDLEVDESKLSPKALENYKTILGIANYNLKKHSEALEILQSLENPNAKFYKALVLLAQGENDKAKEIFLNLKNSSNQEIEANSSFYLAKLKSETSPMNAIYDLKNFVQEHPSHEFSGSAFYLIGWNYFKLNKFQKAEFYLKKSLSFSLDKQMQADAIFLCGESLFAQDKLQESLKFYQDYLNDKSNKNFADQAYYKMGVANYRLERNTVAQDRFKSVINLFPTSSKLASSYFYLGEIEFQAKNYKQAKAYFLQSIAKEKSESTYSRLAATCYKLGELTESSEYLSKVKSVNLYEKYLLEGDIHFSKQKLNLALESYNKALNAKNANKTEIMIRIASVYYNGQDYDNALQIYQDLYKKSNEVDYLLNIANIYFAKEDFSNAVKYFILYKDKSNSSSPDLLFSIANCYYNKGDYRQSVVYYKKVIYPKSKFLQEALDGLIWAGSCDSAIAVESELNQLLAKYPNKSFKSNVLMQKINYFQNLGNSAKTVEACKEFLAVKPQDLQVNLILAKNYAVLGEYKKADNVLSVCKTDNPEVVLSWSKLKLKQNDTLGALDKLQKGALSSKNQPIWLEYLRLLSLRVSPIFESKFAEFSSFANQVYLQQAKIYKVDYLIKSKDYPKATVLVNELRGSKHEEIVSKAGYFLGLIYYEQQQYKEAVIEFLKTVYLFPDRQDLALQANVKAIYCYYYLKDPSRATTIYDKIKNNLTEKKAKEIAFMLGVTYEKDNI